MRYLIRSTTWFLFNLITAPKSMNAVNQIFRYPATTLRVQFMSIKLSCIKMADVNETGTFAVS